MKTFFWSVLIQIAATLFVFGVLWTVANACSGMPGCGDDFGGQYQRSPFSPGSPGSFDSRGRQYQDYGSLSNEQDRNQWSSGQPHRPSDQFTPPVPTTKDQYIYDGRTGQSRLCTSDGRGFTFCQ
jgi:hypothetical protein